MRTDNIIPAGDWGFAPVEVLQREQYDQRTTRIFRGSGTAFLPVGRGCLRVDAIRVGPMPQEELIVHEMPTDASLSRVLPFGHPGWRLITGLDGIPLLQRTKFSNFGEWQKDQEIFVMGEWDEALSPIPEPAAPSDLISHPMAIPPGETEARRRPGRPSNAEIAAREAAGGAP